MNFLWPLTPPILTSEGSCNKNQETIGGHLDSFHANSQTRDHVIQLLTANYWPLRQQSNISVIFAKDELFNSGQITNRLLLPFPVFQPPFPPRQQRHLAFISEFNVQLLYLPSLKNVVADFLSRPPHPPVDQSPPQQRQIKWILKRWPLSNTPAWKRSGC